MRNAVTISKVLEEGGEAVEAQVKPESVKVYERHGWQVVDSPAEEGDEKESVDIEPDLPKEGQKSDADGTSETAKGTKAGLTSRDDGSKTTNQRPGTPGTPS